MEWMEWNGWNGMEWDSCCKMIQIRKRKEAIFCVYWTYHTISPSTAIGSLNSKSIISKPLNRFFNLFSKLSLLRSLWSLYQMQEPHGSRNRCMSKCFIPNTSTIFQTGKKYIVFQVMRSNYFLKLKVTLSPIF